MQFGLYLIKKGVITPHQFVVALDHQFHESRPLGELAVEAGLISRADVYRVLREQATTPDGRFGDAAIALGLLTVEQIEELILAQERYRRPIADILVSLGVMTETIAASELAAFRRQQERGIRQPLLELDAELAILASRG